jgi:hypothetical protein
MQKRQNEGFSYGKQQGKRKGIGSLHLFVFRRIGAEKKSGEGEMKIG